MDSSRLDQGTSASRDVAKDELNLERARLDVAVPSGLPRMLGQWTVTIIDERCPSNDSMQIQTETERLTCRLKYA